MNELAARGRLSRASPLIGRPPSTRYVSKISQHSNQLPILTRSSLNYVMRAPQFALAPRWLTCTFTPGWRKYGNQITISLSIIITPAGLATRTRPKRLNSCSSSRWPQPAILSWCSTTTWLNATMKFS